MEEGFQGIPQPLQEQHTKHSSNFKKRFMRSLGTGLLGLAISNSSVGAMPSPTPDGHHPIPGQAEILPSPELTTPVDLIKQFVEVKGNEDVTFDEAKNMLPDLVNFFSASFEGRYSPEEMIKRVFFVRGNLQKEDDEFSYQLLNDEGTHNFDSPLFKRLLDDYPDILPNDIINNSTVAALYDELASQDTIGFTYDDAVFVFLDRANGHMNYGENQVIQYKSFSDIDCEKATQADNYVHVVLHELGHLDHDYTSGSIESQDLENNEDVLLGNNPSNALKQSSQVDGFQIIIDNKGYKNDFFATGLDENGVEIAVAKMAINNGIPFTTTGFYNSPRALSNFNAILEQAGISAEQLLNFHRSSDLRGLMFKVVDSIRGKRFNSDDEKFRFGLRLFAPLIEGEEAWEIPFKEYFPQINLKGYPDKPYSKPGRSFVGCGVPNIKPKQVIVRD